LPEQDTVSTIVGRSSAVLTLDELKCGHFLKAPGDPRDDFESTQRFSGPQRILPMMFFAADIDGSPQ
ncbi:MAG: hypothetical protein WD039_01405, partial [Xanthobacteraceae bacterium]